MVRNSFCKKVIMQNLTKRNILKLKQSSTLVINEKSKALLAKGRKVYQFGFGQSPFPVPEKIVIELKNNAHRKEYLPIQGLNQLRESISKDLKKKNWSKLSKRKYCNYSRFKRSNASSSCSF